jgi:pimeloyl-ACP methyl ester carboxylesterase
VGHSLGAGVPAAEALAQPGDVSGIVLLDGDALPFGGGRVWLAHVLVYPWFDAALRVLTSSDYLVGRVLRNAWDANAPKLPHAAAELRALMSRGLPGVSLRGLTQIKVRRAVVWGVNDTVDSVSSGRASAAALGVKLELIPGASHLSMLAQPARVARRILRADRN